MSEKQKSYRVGDWIVHAKYGLGKIESRDRKTLGGVKKQYLKVNFSNGFYWLPSSNMDVDYIRPIASEDEINKAMRIFNKAPDELPSDQKLRSYTIAERVKKFSVRDSLKIIRDLTALETLDKINMKEQELLQNLKEQFLNEWHVISEIEKSTLSIKLEKAIKKSYSKLKVT